MTLLSRIHETTVYLPIFIFTIKLKQVNILVNMLNIPPHGHENNFGTCNISSSVSSQLDLEIEYQIAPKPKSHGC